MSGELVKWKPPVSNDSRKVDRALAKLRQSGALQDVRRADRLETRRGQVLNTNAPSPAKFEITDLPRICAVHDKPYAARYIAGPDGRFRYSQTFKVTEDLYLSQYADSINQTRMSGEDLAEESCPWCGGHGFGAVRCGSCGNEICYGKTTGRYFRCRDSCGGQGQMVPQSRKLLGAKPKSSLRGGFRS
jgi:hypothetical protein